MKPFWYSFSFKNEPLKRQVELRSEMAQFNDFIIGDYIDTEENLKLKTFSGYKYINEYCSSIGDHENARLKDNHYSSK